MGLDMYAFKASSLKDKNPVELAYWRKHNALHNWMEQQYTGTKSFNCIKLLLTKKMLEKLRQDILNCNLSATKGFFFGNTDYMERYKDSGNQRKDLIFVNTALDVLSTEPDTIIYYDSWW